MRGNINSSYRWLLCLAVLSILLIGISSAKMGLVSDDYVHFVTDAHKTWYASSDHLIRPLRNGCFRILSSLFGSSPVPYRLLILTLYLFAAFLTYRLATTIGVSVEGAVIATTLFLMFPRNHAVLFWVAASQDPIVAILGAASLIWWLRFRRTGQVGFHAAAVLSYALALGFKETAIIIIVLIVLADLLILPESDHSPKRFAALATVALIYCAGNLLWRQRNVLASDGLYGLSLTGGLSALIRGVANAVLSFGPATALRDLTPYQWVMILGLLAAFTGLALKSPQRRIVAFGSAWFIVALLPSSFFARTINADHYLLFPVMGATIAIGTVLAGLKSRGVTAVLLIAYVAGGAYRMIQYREIWQEASNDISIFRSDLRNLVPDPRQTTYIKFINIEHNRNGIGVLNNGLPGVLTDLGFPLSMSLEYNFAQVDSPDQQVLLNLVKQCSRQVSPTLILLRDGEHLRDVSGSCAASATRNDQLRRPAAWHLEGSSDMPAIHGSD